MNDQTGVIGFGRRKDTTDGLGDWWCDPDQFPRGLRPIADKAHAPIISTDALPPWAIVRSWA